MLYIGVMPNASKKRARLLSSETVYSGPVFSVSTDHVAEPNGVTARRDVIHHAGSVVVLAVDDSGVTPRVLLDASIATQRRTICGSCRLGASIPARRNFRLPSVNCSKRLDIPPRSGAAF